MINGSLMLFTLVYIILVSSLKITVAENSFIMEMMVDDSGHQTTTGRFSSTVSFIADFPRGTVICDGVCDV